MLKPLLILSTMSIFALANAPVAHIDVKNSVQEYLDTTLSSQDKLGGWAILDRKKANNSETFTSTYTKTTKVIADNPMEDMQGLSFDHAIKYSKDTFHAVSTLSKFPSNMHFNKVEKQMSEQIIKDKLLEVTSDYNVVNHKYTASLKDINTTLPEVSLETNAFTLQGVYNPKDLLNQSASVTLKHLLMKPTAQKLAKEYIRIDNISINSQSKAQAKTLTSDYQVHIDTIDSIFMGASSLLKNFNLKMTVGNVDAIAYKSLTEELQSNPTLDINDPKTINTLTNLFTAQGVYLELNDLSVSELKVKNIAMGSGRISAKISLNSTPELAKMIAISPLMALSALEVEAHIELSDAMYQAVMLDKRAMMLQMLTPKRVNGNRIYDISFKQGKLLVNGKPFGPPSH